ncbi:MAG TPA: hypothetical protein V6D17_17565 [Candidatus Obscuribacterales bacterium]
MTALKATTMKKSRFRLKGRQKAALKEVNVVENSSPAKMARVEGAQWVNEKQLQYYIHAKGDPI